MKAFLYRFRVFLPLAAIVLFIGVGLIHLDAKENPYYSIEVSSKPLSRTAIQLKWKKNRSNIKSVSKFKIYRYSGEKEERAIKDFKCIATVSGKTFSYTDKKLKEGQKYVYIVRAYKSVKGKQRLVGETAEEENVTGPGQVQWFEYQRSDTDFSPKQIELSFSVPNGIKPTGYQIYRRIPGDKYKKIKTLKLSAKQSGLEEISYIDKTVKAGQTYYYKVRAYKKSGRKTYYGKKSEELKMSAVHYDGEFASDIMEEDASEGTVTLCLTSEKHNGTLCVDPNLLSIYLEDSSENEEPDVKLKAWSFDGKTWNKDKKIMLSAGKKIYLKLRSENEVKLSKGYLTGRSVYCEDAVYNDLPAILQFECCGTGYARYRMEFIH